MSLGQAQLLPDLELPRLCGTLLPDKSTPCAKRLPNHASRFCAPHACENAAFVAEYKNFSTAVAKLKHDLEEYLTPYSVPSGCRKNERGGTVQWLENVEEVDTATECATTWLNTILEEIAAREAHRERFCQVGVDDRHEHELWLTRLRVDQERAGELVQRLAERRKEFVVVTHKTADDSLDWGGFFRALLIMLVMVTVLGKTFHKLSLIVPTTRAPDRRVLHYVDRNH